MKTTPRSLLFLAVLLLFNRPDSAAQTDVALLQQLTEENKKSVEALVLYPSETRLDILEATKHPEVLIKMQDMREKTSAAFRTLIEDLPRTAQAVFYDLNRYPGLVASLVSQKMDGAAQRRSLEVLPENKREEAFGIVDRQAATLVQVDELNRTTGKAFERLIAGYPVEARMAFEHLLGLPEVIDLLNEDLRFTILVGETYRENPARVIQKTDSLNLAVARSHAEELENWKTDLEKDPAAKAELEAAARDFTKENVYDSEYYDGDDFYEDDYARSSHYFYQPYPYWYGYPYWSPYPRWHPYPWWWDWGGYFRPNHGFVIVYLPSHHFVHWYFWQPEHHHHYNHLSTHFVSHYHGHRRSGTTISTGVREWHHQNRAVISEDFLADKNRLPGRLSEFGKFEHGRQEFNEKNPKKPLSQSDFLDKNAKKYPEINRSREAAKIEAQRENEAERRKDVEWAPPKAPARAEPSPAPKTQKPSKNQPKTDRPTQREPAKKEPLPTVKFPETRVPAPPPKTQPEKATDYHRQKWEERKPAQAPRPERAPAPKSEKAPQKTRKGN